MKKIFVLYLIILCNLSCKAQSVVPIEKAIDYIRAGDGIPSTVTYLKDVNGIRDKYVGTWKGTFNQKKYELVFNKKTTLFDGLTEDRLVMRYLITDLNGKILEDTRTIADENPLIVINRYYEKSFFVLTYEGRQSDCGQGGELFVMFAKNSNSTMQLFLIPKQDILAEEICPNGEATQLFPKEKMTLTKF